MLQAHAGKLLAALVGNLNDRNIIIRKNYANAIGHLVSERIFTIEKHLLVVSMGERSPLFPNRGRGVSSDLRSHREGRLPQQPRCHKSTRQLVHAPCFLRHARSKAHRLVKLIHHVFDQTFLVFFEPALSFTAKRILEPIQTR